MGFWRVEVDFELGTACGEETEGRRRVCEEARESMEEFVGMEVEGKRYDVEAEGEVGYVVNGLRVEWERLGR